MKRNEAHEIARRRASAKLGFYIHLFAYITINLLLVVINFSTSPQYLWFVWPLAGWGIGLLSHAFAVFVGPKLMRRLIERELKNNHS
ncbi:MAG: 2TM domain-containing protein [Candidatus Nealsonbacteria bacterium]|nr:2TM domain-containing protein [Candidatus Nealsonbacteria bacterium]